MKTKQQLTDEAWETYEKAIAPTTEVAWEVLQKRLREINEMKGVKS